MVLVHVLFESALASVSLGAVRALNSTHIELLAFESMMLTNGTKVASILFQPLVKLSLIPWNTTKRS